MFLRILIFGLLLVNLNHHMNFTPDQWLAFLGGGALAIFFDLVNRWLNGKGY